MPSFSDRWGLPSCRKEDSCVRRCRGRRRGNVATCRARLKGWIKNVAARSPIWGDIDISAFCRKMGYSREHATRELSKLRRDGELAFETKMRTKGTHGTKKMGRHRCRSSEALLRQAFPLLRPPWQVAPQLHHACRWRGEDRTHHHLTLPKASARPSAKSAAAGVSRGGK